MTLRSGNMYAIHAGYYKDTIPPTQTTALKMAVA
jgi:hypothetical protein